MLNAVKTKIKSAIPDHWHEPMDFYYANLTSPLHFGDRVVCNVCNHRFRHFIPPGSKERRCPFCRSQSRHRLLTIYLKARKNLFFPGMRLLHMAPERLIQQKFRRENKYQYFSGDLSSPLAMMHFDITDIPFRDNYFDGILCNHVLEHIPDDRAAMRELYRVLKPGGWAILMVPMKDQPETYENWDITTPEQREIHFGQYDHVRWYGWDYEDRLKSVGFQIKWDDFASKIPNKKIERLGLSADELIPFCVKPK